ncbi:fungal-specific transcription factor domain-containing protein [Leptodontidium sp. MPI-SDFR-AT-0119]|nr:fungal-specific transcription factor domain-containing protein [Leptodontidium sp. MPI-SDFR-AT-0119]
MQGSRRAEPRLPFIAPRQQVPPSSLQPGLASSNNPPPESRRSRIPPRSKSGCWYVLVPPEVKCDETRPACGQCVRLGHTCDYNPRVSFKDDTPRILERTKQVSITGSYVWDPNVQDQEPKARALEDTLPLFSTLTTDDERERKAESQDPGTFVVVANLTSFADLPEYRDESIESIRRGSGYSEHDGDNDEQNSLSSSLVEEADDPNVVILKTFEDPIRTAPTQVPFRPAVIPIAPAQSNLSSDRQQLLRQDSSHSDSNTVSLLDAARQGGKNAELLHYYRTTISPQIIRIGKSQGDDDIFEVQAREYPPVSYSLHSKRQITNTRQLFHAIMALSALSIAQKKGSYDAKALEHYQQAIPALQTTVQSSQDSYSDGALLTHLVLLFYEIAAQESNMWQHHYDQLLRIISMRRQVHSADRLDFVIWIIYCIDVYALLSTTGTGMIAEVVLKQNMLPLPERYLLPERAGQPQVICPEEQAYFLRIIAINQEIVLIALRVGRLGKALRAEASQRRFEGSAHVLDGTHNMERRNRIQKLRQLILDSRTKSQSPDYRTPDNLPPRVFEWVEHSYLLFSVCILYTYTSMYSGQLHDPEPDTKAQIEVCCAEILYAVNTILSKERFDPRYIVFPLFLAGFCTRNSTEKDTALRFMIKVEKIEYGGATNKVRRLLQTIYGKQSVAIAETGNANSVDWVDEMEQSGQQLIMYGL